jgi:hypothetical protein
MSLLSLDGLVGGAVFKSLILLTIEEWQAGAGIHISKENGGALKRLSPVHWMLVDIYNSK